MSKIIHDILIYVHIKMTQIWLRICDWHFPHTFSNNYLWLWTHDFYEKIIKRSHRLNKISPHDKVESKQSNCFSRNLTNFVQLPSTCTFKVLQWMLADWVAIVACVLVLISSFTNSEHFISLTTANVCCFVFLGISLSSSIIKLPTKLCKNKKVLSFCCPNQTTGQLLPMECNGLPVRLQQVSNNWICKYR